jgi:hypothetical protein
LNIDSDIESYFAKVATGGYSGLFRFELNLLNRTAAEELTEKFKFHPLVRVLAGLVLDDPNTSSHHVLLHRHPLEGHVLYLTHDDRSRVVFPGLVELLDAAQEAKDQALVVPELHPNVSPHAIDQGALSQLIHSLVEGAEEETDVALALIPSMDLSDTALLEKLAVHEDFYVGEAVGDEIAKRPARVLMPAALLCSRHPHAQAAQAGARAIRAIEECAVD